MTRRKPLPGHLREAPFRVDQAHAAGVSRSRLRAADLCAPTRGVRRMRDDASPHPEPGATASERMRMLSALLRSDVEGFAPALTPHQFFSHETGLALLGAPLPYTSDARRQVHVSVRRPHALPRRRGVHGHRLQARESARWHVDSLPIEHPARMWRQAASDWQLDDLIVAGDFLVHPRNKLVTIDDLRREIAEAGDVGGRLGAALREIRAGAESPEETRLRLLLTRAGLPEPELNMNLFDADGAFVARLDLAYPRFRVAPEYDGRGHAEADQFARDADRWDGIRAEGWEHVRILSHHLRPDPQVAIDKVAVALFAAGWRPGRT
ncbi:hypothetical protein ACFWHT_06050 [Microbacterium sp. NPDC058342]|uniref:hypothetical protein n=1 Tax=Microbacterium sp. NPDC058342 TaxID=3346454 RepID=UPI003659E306